MSGSPEVTKRIGAGMTAASAGLYVVLGAIVVLRHKQFGLTGVSLDKVLDEEALPGGVFLTVVALVGTIMTMASVRPKAENKEMYMMAGALVGVLLMMYAVFAMGRSGGDVQYWLALVGVPTAVLAAVVSARLGPVPAAQDKKLKESSRRNANHVAPCNWCHWAPAWWARY